ncbi:MAG: C10 family peptidase, partial [Bacteroidaceae bacterium]|nr:C10 family peptidase [Bacteroidaceae bacterium]
SGHAFIIDGYRFDGSTPYYHVNWGWDGSDNAYFLIDNMRPSEAGTGGYNDNYSYDYTLFFGIQPENNIDEGIALSSSYTVDKSTYSAGNTIAFSISRLKNISCVTFTGNVKAYACSGNRCYELGTIISPYDLGPGYYYSNISRSFTLPSTIPTGTYRIIMKAQQTGSSVEKEVYTAEAPEVQINGSFLPGDVDMSGEVNITDVVALVNYILSNDNSSSALSTGDMDGNGSIDITDVVALVNLILSN